MSLKTNTNKFNCYSEDEINTVIADYHTYKSVGKYKETLATSDLVGKIMDAD